MSMKSEMHSKPSTTQSATQNAMLHSDGILGRVTHHDNSDIGTWNSDLSQLEVPFCLSPTQCPPG